MMFVFQLCLCNKTFFDILVVAGINTGSYYGIGTLLNRIILDYFEVFIPSCQTQTTMIFCGEYNKKFLIIFTQFSRPFVSVTWFDDKM
jgi:hypothetical protein